MSKITVEWSRLELRENGVDLIRLEMFRVELSR